MSTQSSTATGRARPEYALCRASQLQGVAARDSVTFQNLHRKERLSQQADIALASFKAGVCVSANLSIGQFDSHNNNDPDQMKLIPELLAGIDYLVTRAEELQIRDKLVVIMQSEMGRTPTYNKGNGKDHWSVGSIMFMGPGIQGNRVVGATDEKQFLIPINSKTLETDADEGIRVRPSIFTSRCGSSPVSMPTPPANSSRWMFPAKSDFRVSFQRVDRRAAFSMFLGFE